MKTHTHQHGFFHLGLGVVLFAVFGTTSYVASDNMAPESQQQLTFCNDIAGTDEKTGIECIKNNG